MEDNSIRKEFRNKVFQLFFKKSFLKASIKIALSYQGEKLYEMHKLSLNMEV